MTFLIGRSLFSLSTRLLGALLLLTLSSTALNAQGKVRIVVSVDWEGRSLEAENLAAFNAFRNDYPKIPLQLFLNAAYYTKADADPKLVTESIRSVMRPGDEEGLHIHAWRSLFTAAGVKFRTEPAFKGPIDLEKCTPDCGHDVNITAYSEAELRKVIAFSIKTLKKNGFTHPHSFRAGAWQADRKVLRALAAEGFTLDSSATDADFLKERWGKTLLYPVTKKIWPDTVASTQPYSIDLGDGRKILELPNNGCLADYVSGESIFESFQKNLALLKANPEKDVYLSIGFHQETAVKFLPNLRKGIDLIQAAALEQKIPVEFVVQPLGI
jgi:predicted deacetylase